jgi:hypothetical protein
LVVDVNLMPPNRLIGADLKFKYPSFFLTDIHLAKQLASSLPGSATILQWVNPPGEHRGFFLGLYIFSMQHPILVR